MYQIAWKDTHTLHQFGALITASAYKNLQSFDANEKAVKWNITLVFLAAVRLLLNISTVENRTHPRQIPLQRSQERLSHVIH
jgi:hypothetical protein